MNWCSLCRESLLLRFLKLELVSQYRLDQWGETCHWLEITLDIPSHSGAVDIRWFLAPAAPITGGGGRGWPRSCDHQVSLSPATDWYSSVLTRLGSECSFYSSGLRCVEVMWDWLWEVLSRNLISPGHDIVNPLLPAGVLRSVTSSDIRPLSGQHDSLETTGYCSPPGHKWRATAMVVWWWEREELRQTWQWNCIMTHMKKGSHDSPQMKTYQQHKMVKPG